MNVLEAIGKVIVGCKACLQAGSDRNKTRAQALEKAKEQGKATGQRMMVIGMINNNYVIRTTEEENSDLTATEYISTWY